MHGFYVSPYLSRIEGLPPKQDVGGSIPPGDAISCRNRMVWGLFSCRFYALYFPSAIILQYMTDHNEQNRTKFRKGKLS